MNGLRTDGALRPERIAPAPSPTSGAAQLARGLASLHVREVYGVLGSSVAPTYDALRAVGLSVVHARHEAGAMFMAAEGFLATGRPGCVFTTTGPGLANALIGLAAAAAENATVFCVAGASDPRRLRSAPFQRTGREALGLLAALGQSRARLYEAYLETEGDLHRAIADLGELASARRPVVALLLVPPTLQSLVCERGLPPVLYGVAPGRVDDAQLDDAVLRLNDAPFVVWCGAGANAAAPHVRALVARTGARVMCTPRAKGVVPETSPVYLGVTGMGGHARVVDVLARERPNHVLVLGSRLSELDCYYDPRLAPRLSFIHVDPDPRVHGSSYPGVPTLGVQASVGAFLDAALPRLAAPAAPWECLPRLSDDVHEVFAEPGEGVDPRDLMAAIQRVIVDASDAVVMTEAGNSFAWTPHMLRFATAGRHRVSTAYGAMGHFAAGVVGAAHATGARTVAVVGDGAMAMLDETSTAAALGVPATWVVLNDSRYGMVEQGMTAVGFDPVGLAFPRMDLAAVARAKGVTSFTVRTPDGLEEALFAALAVEGPSLVDVIIDPRVRAPMGRRNDLVVHAPRSGAA